MSASVLVGYATRYGSTQEVAEAVAATLRERGLAVDIQPMREVLTLDQYRAVVLGAPLYMFHWHRDALHFLAQHREALTQRPVLCSAHFMLMGKNFRKCVSSSRKSWRSFPG